MPSSREASLEICSSCIRKCGHDPDVFLGEISGALSASAPEIEWNVRRRGCLRVCPSEKIAFAANSRISMSYDTAPESLIEEARSLILLP